MDDASIITKKKKLVYNFFDEIFSIEIKQKEKHETPIPCVILNKLRFKDIKYSKSNI